MPRLTICETVLRALGVLLIAAALLKGHQLMTELVVNRDFWSYRPFLIFQIESELALGIWLLSRLFRRLAWLVAVLCFGLFCCITLYKALAGAASCGCFGKVHVNPWITLAIVDLPAVVALIAFRPMSAIANLRCSTATILRALRLLWRALYHVEFSVTAGMRHSHFEFVLRKLVSPIPSRALQVTVSVVIAVLIATTPVLALVKPAKVTSTYEVLEPKMWIGKELPILDHIDIADQLKGGNWLVVLYHHDCPDCQIVIPKYKRMAGDIQGSEDYLRIALIEIHPYEEDLPQQDNAWVSGRVDESKQWFVVTPAAMMVVNGCVQRVYDKKVPDIATVLSSVVEVGEACDTHSSQTKHP
jgi:hypothetical protein